jgi:hypothetical protein
LHVTSFPVGHAVQLGIDEILVARRALSLAAIGMTSFEMSLPQNSPVYDTYMARACARAREGYKAKTLTLNMVAFAG